VLDALPTNGRLQLRDFPEQADQQITDAPVAEPEPAA